MHIDGYDVYRSRNIFILFGYIYTVSVKLSISGILRTVGIHFSCKVRVTMYLPPLQRLCVYISFILFNFS